MNGHDEMRQTTQAQKDIADDGVRFDSRAKPIRVAIIRLGQVKWSRVRFLDAFGVDDTQIHKYTAIFLLEQGEALLQERWIRQSVAPIARGHEANVGHALLQEIVDVLLVFLHQFAEVIVDLFAEGVTELEVQGAAHHHHGDYGNNDDRQQDIAEQGPVVGGAGQIKRQQVMQNVNKGHICKTLIDGLVKSHHNRWLFTKPSRLNIDGRIDPLLRPDRVGLNNVVGDVLPFLGVSSLFPAVEISAVGFQDVVDAVLKCRDELGAGAGKFHGSDGGHARAGCKGRQGDAVIPQVFRCGDEPPHQMLGRD